MVAKAVSDAPIVKIGKQQTINKVFKDSVARCKKLVTESLILRHERQRKVGSYILGYLERELSLLNEGDEASCDIQVLHRPRIRLCVHRYSAFVSNLPLKPPSVHVLPEMHISSVRVRNLHSPFSEQKSRFLYKPDFFLHP